MTSHSQARAGRQSESSPKDNGACCDPLLGSDGAPIIHLKSAETPREKEKEEESSTQGDEDENEQGQDEDDDFPDGGWGWVVTLGCCIIAALVNTVGPCFGILFSRFLKDLGTSSVNVAWIYNARAFTLSLTQLLLGPLVLELGWRRLAFCAGLLVAFGLGASAFAVSAVYLLFSYSLMTGIGSGLEVGLLFTIIPHYFRRKRGIANALMNLGISTGQMAGPLLISYLQGLYGFCGSTLILSAIVLNCCVGASVFQPVEWHTKRRRSRKKSEAERGLVPEEEKGALKAAARFFCHVFQNLKLLRSPRVLVIALGSSLNTTGFLNFLMMAPFALQAAGHSLEESSWCMSVFGLCNLVMRLLVSSLTDWPRFSKRGCYMAGTALAFVSVITFSFLRDLTWAKVVMGLWGCGVGSFMGIHSLIMVEYVGLEKLVSTLGVCGITNGLCFILVGPLIGVIRDVSQSYAVSMWALSGCFATSFGLWLLMPLAVACDRRRERQREAPA